MRRRHAVLLAGLFFLLGAGCEMWARSLTARRSPATDGRIADVFGPGAGNPCEKGYDFVAGKCAVIAWGNQQLTGNTCHFVASEYKTLCIHEPPHATKKKSAACEARDDSCAVGCP